MSSWYYVENDNRKGPVTEEEIKQLIENSRLGPDTLVWKDGMQDWAAASAQFGFPNTPPNIPPALGAATGTGSSAGRQARADGLYAGAPSRGFGEAISVGFSKYVDFSGRASRSEFWYWTLFTVIASFITGMIDGLFFPYNDVMPFNSLFSLAVLLPGLAVAFRRLHDIDRSGWWVGGFLLALIAGGALIGGAIAGNPYGDGPFLLAGLLGIGALAYGILLLVFYCKVGDNGPNRFG